MLYYSHLAASAIALMAVAAAQSTLQTHVAQKIPGAVKHAGIYHVATGTWTRTGGAVANFGPDTIYSNTAPSGYFSPVGGSGNFAPGSTNIDNGLVPSSANTNHPAANRDEYIIKCVEIGYCDFSVGGTTSWELSFYNSYEACESVGAPDTTFDTGMVPQNGCWTVVFDLSGGAEFCLPGDGGDGFDDILDQDTFGWSFRYTGVTTTPGEAGFYLAGDPKNTDPGYVPLTIPTDGTNTYFGPASLCGTDAGTGLGNYDSWRIEDPVTPVNSGCSFFGGYDNNNACGATITTPHASWHMELQADNSICNVADIVVSTPNGCTSNPNSTGVNSTMVVTGSAVITDNDLTLTAMIPVETFGFFFTSQSFGMAIMPGGSSGNICVGGNIGRFSSSIQSSGADGTFEISTAAGEFDFNAIPQGGGSYSAVPGGTAHFQCWHRDVFQGSATSNFTDGVVVTWR